jgi:hypothetical protein
MLRQHRLLDFLGVRFYMHVCWLALFIPLAYAINFGSVPLVYGIVELLGSLDSRRCFGNVVLLLKGIASLHSWISHLES